MTLGTAGPELTFAGTQVEAILPRKTAIEDQRAFHLAALNDDAMSERRTGAHGGTHVNAALKISTRQQWPAIYVWCIARLYDTHGGSHESTSRRGGKRFPRTPDPGTRPAGNDGGRPSRVSVGS